VVDLEIFEGKGNEAQKLKPEVPRQGGYLERGGTHQLCSQEFGECSAVSLPSGTDEIKGFSAISAARMAFLSTSG